ncbi:hypothetical protein Brsp06_04660 [Brucella sp. NBRC 13694]|uniref:SxtJ family membrane protein n=1 Tax=Brucella/Ochrobactrum group TaxID=2826938 RepID=UPI000F66968B|nr:SxtJ family membrane protein [Brucella anthropi]MCQ9147663.1 hypothetical protein [Ochrobactrum sp. BTU2]MCR5943632.1 hypothetical protein [Ochrobactrum sp. XJ1]
MSNKVKIHYKDERSFGILIAIVFLIVFAYLSVFRDEYNFALIAISSISLFAALFTPRILRWPNLLWRKLGIFLGRIVSPIVLGLIFLFAVFPTGIAMRLLGKDPLRLRKQHAIQSYWVDRSQRTVSFTDQF